MAFAWKQAGLTYNRYLAVAARVVRRSLKEGPRLQAERRGEMELRFAKWENGKQGENKSLASANAAAMAEGAEKIPHLSIDDEAPAPPHNLSNGQSGQIVSSGELVSVQDITQDFHKAARALYVGHLVQDESFTLYDAVGALEIMDPKMDGGYLTKGESLDDDYDVLRELSLEEVLGIMDQLLCFEMSWHMGYPLHQTLYSSHYIDRLLNPEPESFEEAVFDRDGNKLPGNELLHVVLRAFCLGVIKTCDCVHYRISTEKHFEDEDFVMNLYRRPLLSDLPLDRFIELQMEAIEYLEDLDSTNMDLKMAICKRLNLREQLLRAVNPEAVLLEENGNQWNTCQELTQTLSNDHSLATLVPDAYSMKLQRRLTTTTPPRPVVEIPFKEAMAYLSMLCLGCKGTYHIMSYHGFATMLNFVRLYQSRKPQPPVYVRCMLQALVWNDGRVLGCLTAKSIIFTDLVETVLPASNLVDPKNDEVEAPTDSRFTIAHTMELFTRQVTDAVLDTFVTLSMNRARVRRILCHSVIEWDWIVHKVDEYDQQLLQYRCDQKASSIGRQDLYEWKPLSVWAKGHKIRQMEWIVQMGFELDIYHIDEMAGMYWYLQYLAHARLRIFIGTQHCNLIRLKDTPRFAQKKRGVLQHSLKFAEYNIVEVSAIHAFADGLSCLYSFLAHVGLTPAPYHDFPYSTPTLRYQLRMKPFTTIVDPPCPSFEQFMALVSLQSSESTASEVSEVARRNLKQQALGILEVAGRSMQEAQKKWSAISKWTAYDARCITSEQLWRADVRNILRSCIRAGVAIDHAKKAVTSHGTNNLAEKLQVDILPSGENDHPWWIVPRIEMKKT